MAQSAADFDWSEPERNIRPKLAQARLRAEIGDLLIKGWDVKRIARELDLSRGMVQWHIDAIHEYWLSLQGHANAVKVARSLAKLQRLESLANAAWERSCEDAETTATKEGGKYGTEVTTTVKGQCGDPRFLAEVRACIAAHDELLGLAPNVKELQKRADELAEIVEQLRSEFAGLTGEVERHNGSGEGTAVGSSSPSQLGVTPPAAQELPG